MSKDKQRKGLKATPSYPLEDEKDEEQLMPDCGPSSPTSPTATVDSLTNGTDEFVNNNAGRLNVQLTALSRTHYLKTFGPKGRRTALVSLVLAVLAFILRRPGDFGLSCSTQNAWYLQAHGYWHPLIAVSAMLSWWTRWSEDARYTDGPPPKDSAMDFDKTCNELGPSAPKLASELGAVGGDGDVRQEGREYFV
jgi:hypothetical protein